MSGKILIKQLLLCTSIITVLHSCNLAGKKRTARLNYEFSGCFGYSVSTINIYREDTVTTAEIFTDQETPLQVHLDNQQIQAFNTFVQELKELKEEGGCTSVEDYTLYIDNARIRKVDASCNWKGFSKLQKALFNIAE